MRTLLAVIAGLLFTLCANSQDNIHKSVPPVSGKTETGDKQSEKAKTAQEITVNFPAGVNVTVSGEVKTVGNAQKNSTQEETSKWADPVTWLTFVLAGANILLWLTTKDIANEAKAAGVTAKKAADAARESADAAKVAVEVATQNASRELRAYVFVDGTKVSHIPALPNGKVGLEITIIFRNFGKTPAYAVKHIGSAYVEDQITHERSRESTTQLARMDAGPNMPIIRKYIFFCQPNELAEIMQGKNLLFSTGAINYIDEFNAPQVFPYAMVYGGPESVLALGTLRPYEDDKKT